MKPLKLIFLWVEITTIIPKMSRLIIVKIQTGKTVHSIVWKLCTQPERISYFALIPKLVGYLLHFNPGKQCTH